jgi:hypothetical protein
MSNDYIERLVREHSLAIEMLEGFMEDHSDVFEAFRELVDEVNKCATTLDAELKEVKEEDMFGSHRRSYSSSMKVDSQKFVMAYHEEIKQFPQLIKEVDAKMVDNAIKAGVLPEDAKRFVFEKITWKTNPKPKVISLRLR